MNQDLIVTFGKGDGGTHDWTYKGLDPNLSAPEIKEACELLTNLDISTQNGVKLFDSVITAKVLTHKETLMFDPEHETKGIPYHRDSLDDQTCEDVRCFEVVDEPKVVAPAKQVIQPKEKVGLMPPSLPLLDSTKQPHGRRFEKLVNVEHTEKSVKVEKAAFPRVTIQQPTTETLRQDTSLPTSTAQSQELLSTPDSPKKGWLHRLFKRKSRNKEDPESPPNDPVSRE